MCQQQLPYYQISDAWYVTQIQNPFTITYYPRLLFTLLLCYGQHYETSGTTGVTRGASHVNGYKE